MALKFNTLPVVEPPRHPSGEMFTCVLSFSFLHALVPPRFMLWLSCSGMFVFSCIVSINWGDEVAHLVEPQTREDGSLGWASDSRRWLIGWASDSRRWLTWLRARLEKVAHLVERQTGEGGSLVERQTRDPNTRQEHKKMCEFFRVKNVVLTCCWCAQPLCV